jgi:hypothetical protein
MRRWKMMFDRHGDVLRCEQLDGPPLRNGQELIVVEEREVPHRGGGSPTPDDGPKGRGLPGGDSLERPFLPSEVPTEIDPAREIREPIVA